MGGCCSAPADGAGGSGAGVGVRPTMDKSRREELKNRVVDLGDGFKVRLRRPPPLH